MACLVIYGATRSPSHSAFSHWLASGGTRFPRNGVIMRAQAGKGGTADTDGMFALPALFSKEDSRPIVLFDGECNLCNKGLNYLMDHDRCSEDERGNLRVSALQSSVGRLLLRRLPEEKRERALNVKTGTYKSIVVVREETAHVGSDAVLYIARSALSGPLRLLGIAGAVLPRKLRDSVYSFVSSRRERWFGKAPECRVWDDNFDTRFVPDEMVTGESSDASQLPPGTAVRVTCDQPVIIMHKKQYPNGLCLQGLVGEVKKSLLADQRFDDRPYDVLVNFKSPQKFVAHLASSELSRVEEA